MAKYHIIAYLLAFNGEVEAASEEEAASKVRQICKYPEIAPIVLDFVEDAVIRPPAAD